MGIDEPKFDGLWPDKQMLAWHIPVRCRAGLAGDLPIPKTLVPDSDALLTIQLGLAQNDLHVLVLVGEAGTGKTTALGNLLFELTREQASCDAIRCNRRTSAEVQDFLARGLAQGVRVLVIDGLDELLGGMPASLDSLLAPASAALLAGRCKVIVSIRRAPAVKLFDASAGEVQHSLEWGCWSGALTVRGLRVAALKLQDLRQQDVRDYARLRGLPAGFSEGLRDLYDLRELVSRFFLLVKLCDLAGQLDLEEWRKIKQRPQLYERLLTTWLTVERSRSPEQALSLEMGDVLRLLENLALCRQEWLITPSSYLSMSPPPLHNRLAAAIGKCCPALGRIDPLRVAAALINASIITEDGFAHKSIQEYLLARAILRGASRGAGLLLPEISGDVIDFLTEFEDTRIWLDANQLRINQLDPTMATVVVRLIHRLGRVVPGLDLGKARLSGLSIPGIKLARANLREAEFQGACLGGADFSQADLRGADLREVRAWTTTPAWSVYPCGDARDCHWLISQTEDGEHEATLIRITASYGQVLQCHYSRRPSHIFHDGHCLYVLNPLQRGPLEVTQYFGRSNVKEHFSLKADALPMISLASTSGFWEVDHEDAVLHSSDGSELEFRHPHMRVRGTLARPAGSDFKEFGVDGFCLLGTELWALGPKLHRRCVTEVSAMHPLHQLVAIGRRRVVVLKGTGWCSLPCTLDETTHHLELSPNSRVIALPSGAFAVVTEQKVEFRDFDFEPERDLSGFPFTQSVRECAGLLTPDGDALVARINYIPYLQLLGRDGVCHALDWLHALRVDGVLYDNKTRSSITSKQLRDQFDQVGELRDDLIVEAPQLPSGFGSSLSIGARRGGLSNAGDLQDEEARRTIKPDDPRLMSLVERLSVHPSKPSGAKIRDWLLQFRKPRWIDLAMHLLGNLTFRAQAQMAEKTLDQLLGKSRIDLRTTIFSPMGDLTGSAIFHTYFIGKKGIEESHILTLEAAATKKQTSPIEQIIFLDDIIGEGRQAAETIDSWFGNKKDNTPPTLSTAAQDLLRTTTLTYAVAYGFTNGAERIEKAAEAHGLKISIEIHQPLNPAGCFDSYCFPDTRERQIAKAMAAEIGYELLAEYSNQARAPAKKVWTNQQRKENALGFGNVAQLLVFDTAPPTSSLTLLWKDGLYQKRPWEALFPRKD